MHVLAVRKVFTFFCYFWLVVQVMLVTLWKRQIIELKATLTRKNIFFWMNFYKMISITFSPTWILLHELKFTVTIFACSGVYPNTLPDLRFCIQDWVSMTSGHRTTCVTILKLLVSHQLWTMAFVISIIFYFYFNRS